MAQTDMNVANGTGAAVRADINLHLAALVSNNSGDTEPTTKFADMFWMDTSLAASPDFKVYWKRRNEANTAWQTVGYFDLTNDTFVPFSGDTPLEPSKIPFKDRANVWSARQSFAWGDDVSASGVSEIEVDDSGNIFNVTGPISGISSIANGGSIGGVGSTITLVFQASGTLTHSTNLQLPGSTDLAVNTDDVAEFVQISTSPVQWKLYNYMDASASPKDNSGPLSLIGEVSLGASGVAEFTSFPTNFKSFQIHFETARPADGAAGDANGLGMRFSTDGGTSFAATDYMYTVQHQASGSAFNDLDVDSSADTEISLTRGSRLTSTNKADGIIHLSNINVASQPAIVRCEYSVREGNSIAVGSAGGGRPASLQVNAVQLRAIDGTGDLASGGRFRLFGVQGS